MKPEDIKAEGAFRTNDETEASREYARIFDASADPTEIKLQNFTKYIRRQNATKFMACYEIFKKITGIKGSVVECGVYRGFTLMAWALISEILEPVNFTRKIYGFDTFEGFPGVSAKDKSRMRRAAAGELCSDSYDELTELARNFDKNRLLNHMNKIELVKGKAGDTIPAFIDDNPHLVISLLFLDFDLYEPTKTAIEYFYPRIPRGGIIAFDELDNPMWPGETSALLDSLGIGALKVQRLDFDPYIGFAVKE